MHEDAGDEPGAMIERVVIVPRWSGHAADDWWPGSVCVGPILGADGTLVG